MKNLLSILFFLTVSTIYSQVDTSAAQTHIDDLVEEAVADKENIEYYDLIEYLLQNKIRLNGASIDDLLKIPYLDRQTASAIIRQRNMLGGIISEHQLRGIEGLNSELIDNILPFFQLGEKQEISFFDSLTDKLFGINLSFRSRIMNDLQEDRAYRQNKYDGSGLKIYNRIILRKENKIRFGLLTEKDPGEKSITDFTTFHFYVRDLGVVKSILAGDYLFEFGQGLALWSRYSISKGTETVRILPRNGKGIIPYLSSDENLFLRGAALQLSFSDLNLYTFISSKRLDGTINSVTNEISAIRIDGFHRDQNEINHQKIISEKIFGLSAEYNIGENASFGFLYYSSIYGNNFQVGTLPDPSGNRFNYFSASYNFSFNKLTFSGESSYNSKSIATINSAELAVDRNFTLLFSYRNYPKSYWGLHSNGFGEKDGTQNERGFYSGLKMRTELGTFYFYYDQFIYPYTSEKIPFASNGNEFLFYYTVRPFPNSEFRFRYTYQNKDNPAIIDDQYSLIKKRTENIRFELTYRASKNIQIRSRVNLSLVNPPSEKGILLFQEIKYLFLQTLNLSARVIFFRTDSYNSRIYEFENDLRGVMTNPPLYGEGIRWYIVAQYKTAFGFNLSMKYSELFKPGERTLGSGDTEIQGNLDNRISFQIDWQI